MWQTCLKSSKSAPCNYVDFLLQDSGFLIATFCISILQQTLQNATFQKNLYVPASIGLSLFSLVSADIKQK
jgi:hypothetical protein